MGGEGDEEGGDDVVNVGCEGSVPLFPFGVGVGEREIVEDVGGEEVWEFLYEALGEEAELGLFIRDGGDEG